MIKTNIRFDLYTIWFNFNQKKKTFDLITKYDSILIQIDSLLILPI